MKTTLSDIVRQTASLFKFIRVSGTDTETIVSGVSEDKRLFLQATTKSSIQEFKGEFAVTNLPLLNSLLNFASYNADGSSFVVKREHPVKDTVTSFEINDPTGKGAKFRTSSPEVAGERAIIGKIDWDVSILPAKAKIAEFAQLGPLFSSVDDHFSVQIIDDALVFRVGADNSSTTHCVDIVFAQDITGVITGEPLFSTKTFLGLLKIAGSYPATLTVSSKGLMSVSYETELVNYNYYMRAKKK